MDFIIGGAYQGKLDYAKEKYNLKDEDIFICQKDAPIDFSFPCIYKIENYVYYCLKNKQKPQLPSKDSIVIGEDIFCGIVPMDAFLRLWREESGRYYQQLSKNSETVTRIFCGLPQKIK